MRQAAANIHLKIADVHFQGFFGLAAGHAAAHQGRNNLFTQGLGQLIEFAADGGLVDTEHTGNLGQSTAIEVVRTQNHSIFAGE